MTLLESFSLNLEVVADIRRVLLTPSRHLHVGLIVLYRPPFFISPNGVARQVRIVRIQRISYLLFLFRGRLPSSANDTGRRRPARTFTNPQTNDSGKPYLSTVSTNTRKTSTCTHAITASPQLVRANRRTSPQSFLSSFETLSNSFFSSSFPPSLNL